jgi:hypothetical protein
MQMAKMKALAGMAGQQSAMFEASVGCFWEFIRKKNFQQNTSIYERWRRSLCILRIAPSIEPKHSISPPA